MRILKNSFLWQFGGGFVLGAVGLIALQPATARDTFVGHFTPAAMVQR